MAIHVVGAIAVATFVFEFLKLITPTLVKWVLISLGVGFVTYFGMDALTDYAIDQVFVYLDGLPANALILVDRCGFVKALNIFIGGITAGLTVRFSMRGMSAAGSVTKFKLTA